MTPTKTSKISLNKFNDKRFYVNIVKSYPHDENLYLFKTHLVNKICKSSLHLDKDQLANKFPELIIHDDRKLMEAAIRLFNDL